MFEKSFIFFGIYSFTYNAFSLNTAALRLIYYYHVHLYRGVPTDGK